MDLAPGRHPLRARAATGPSWRVTTRSLADRRAAARTPPMRAGRRLLSARLQRRRVPRQPLQRMARCRICAIESPDRPAGQRHAESVAFEQEPDMEKIWLKQYPAGV